MIVEVRVEYKDQLNNHLFEVLEISVDKEENLEQVLEDEVNSWFFITAEELFNEFWNSETNSAEEGTCYDFAFETYLNSIEFLTDID